MTTEEAMKDLADLITDSFIAKGLQPSDNMDCYVLDGKFHLEIGAVTVVYDYVRHAAATHVNLKRA
jgi:hypothetical protein